ncbi:MAG: GvpL/GvpF family gas vesicle protein [Candidatus Binatia bacterium]
MASYPTQYLYAIVDGLPRTWRPPAGVDDGPVTARALDAASVVLGDVVAVPPSSPRTLARHHDVVTSTLEADAVLPFRYGVGVPSGELPAWLAGRRAAITAALVALRGRVEMSVKLLRLDLAVAFRPRTAHPPGPGEGELRALADRLVERAALDEWRYRPSGGPGNVVASLAFLVPKTDVAAFLARIAPIASRAVGVAVVPTGPWPAYAFAPSLERRDRETGGERRVG